MAKDFQKEAEMNASDFVLLSDYVPAILQEIRYFSTYNFVGERVDVRDRHQGGGESDQSDQQQGKCDGLPAQDL